jgi:hypothetical protein
MKHTKAVFFLFFLVCHCTFSQVNGLFAPKINAISASTTAWNNGKPMEFEPNFTYNRSANQWSGDGIIQPSYSNDSVLVNSELSFRMALAIDSSFEVAGNATADLSTYSLSGKYILPGQSKLRHAALVGINFIGGNRVFIPGESDALAWALGYAATYQINKDQSIDVNLQHFAGIADYETTNGYLYAIDYGIYFGTVLTAFSYTLAYLPDQNQWGHTIYPGIIFEHAEEYAIALNALIDIYGINYTRSNGFNLAFTIMLE